MYYRWSKTSLEAGKNGLTRDTQREATGEGRRTRTDAKAAKKKR